MGRILLLLVGLGSRDGLFVVDDDDVGVAAMRE